MANSPQNILIYDPTLKCLYSGQENGKINKWEMNSSYPSYIFDVYDEKNKFLIQNLSKKKINKTKTKKIFHKKINHIKQKMKKTLQKIKV